MSSRTSSGRLSKRSGGSVRCESPELAQILSSLMVPPASSGLRSRAARGLRCHRTTVRPRGHWGTQRSAKSGVPCIAIDVVRRSRRPLALGASGSRGTMIARRPLRKAAWGPRSPLSNGVRAGVPCIRGHAVPDSPRQLVRGGRAEQGGNMIARRPYRTAAWAPIAVLAAVFAVAVGAIPSASAASSGTVKPPAGAVAPQPGTGMGTAAAMNNPLCNTDPRFGPYGRWNSALVGGGPVCVVPMKAGAKNSGASAPGVTANSIKVVFLQPSQNAQSALSQSTAGNPVNLNGNTKGTYDDGAHDYLASLVPHYETWGRNISVVNYTSSGNDEASQRADAVAILAMKPFAVINVDSAGLDVFEAAVAKGKTLVFGYGTSPEEADAQAPYRWGAQDNRVAGLTAAELVGKQLAGGKAQFAGDALKSTPRKFGIVNVDAFDPAGFVKEAAKYKVKIADSEEYPGT